jgi:hypothetical protein
LRKAVAAKAAAALFLALARSLVRVLHFSDHRRLVTGAARPAIDDPSGRRFSVHE